MDRGTTGKIAGFGLPVKSLGASNSHLHFKPPVKGYCRNLSPIGTLTVETIMSCNDEHRTGSFQEYSDTNI